MSDLLRRDSKMKAACACLACSGGGDRLADFFDRNWIVGHYDDFASFDSDDYAQRGAGQLDQMRDCAVSSNEYLCSLRVAKKIDIPNGKTTQGQQITSEQRKIGIIEPDTTPLYVFSDGDGGYEKYPLGKESEATNAFENSGAEYLYKVVPMSDDTRIFQGPEYRLNEYETPNTFSPWDTFAPQLEALYNGEDLPKMSATSYTSDQTELLCEEYIRQIHPEFYPLIQTGGSTGTNQGVDILGEVPGKTIIGEVKNKEQIEDGVLKTLRNYASSETEAYYFIRGDDEAEGVNVISIETVLKELSEGSRDKMLERMTAY